MTLCDMEGEGSGRCVCTHGQTRNSSEYEIANVNFLYENIVHALENTRLLHKFRQGLFSATPVYQIQ